MKANKEATATANRRRGRRRRLWSRSKVKKKPKFLSLKANFPANDRSNDYHDDDVKRSAENVRVDEIRECHDHENVALFFSGGEGGAATLTGLLDAAVSCGNSPSDLPLVDDSSSSRLDQLSLSSASPTYGYATRDPAALVRSALRSKERDSSEDKWVCYSEVVERKGVAVKEEEVSSSAVCRRPGIGGLSLKLDRYEEILNAWGRPLFIDSDSSAQIVPDDDEELIISQCQGLWTVPEMAVGDSIENAQGGKATTMMRGDREASLLRYKEKRLNRLFSKTIRYQVRKLNAEKRPRLKGRFIKRS